MPVFNFTIDDTSPLIQYSAGWGDSSHSDDYWSDYNNGTFHATSAYGSTATLTFNGSAVYLYGAFRPNHDVYWATLDGVTTIGNGNSNSSANIFQQCMFSASGLSNDQHTLILQNKYSTTIPSWVDVDYIAVTAGDGNAQAQAKDIIWDDNAANITYGDGWDSTPNGLESNYYNSTMHRTSVYNAAAYISFSGNAIRVYGATSLNHQTFGLSLDGGDILTLNGSAPVARYQELLYWASGLSNDLHNLTLFNSDSTGNWFDLDKVVVSQWGSTDSRLPLASGSSTSSFAAPFHTSTGQDTSGGTQHETSTAAIAGGIIAGVAVLIVIGLGLYFLFVRKSRRRKGIDRIQTGALSKEDLDIIHEDEDIIGPFQYGERPGTASSHGNISRVDVSELTPLSPSTSMPAHTVPQVDHSPHTGTSSIASPQRAFPSDVKRPLPQPQTPRGVKASKNFLTLANEKAT